MFVYRGNGGGKLLKSRNGGRLYMCEWKMEELERRRRVRGERGKKRGKGREREREGGRGERETQLWLF